MAELNKIKNTKRNIAFGIISKLISMFFPFVIRSIILYELGVNYLGLGSLFSSILQVLSLAELGFGSAIVFSMYKPIANDDRETICALLNLYRKIYFVIGTVILVAGASVAPFLRFLISKDCPEDVNTYILYFINLANVVIGYFFFGYKESLLLAHQRVDVDKILMIVFESLMYGAQIALLVIFKNYYYYLICLPLMTLSINLCRNVVVDRMFPLYRASGTIGKDDRKEIYKRVFGLMLSRICQVCRNSFDSIVISMFLGLILLGRYQNYYYIMNMVIAFLTILTTSIVAGVGNDVVTKTKEENYQRFLLFHFVYNWIASWCCVCLLCLYQPFMKIWVGQENMLSFALVVCMCVYFYSLKVGDVTSLYRDATGMFWIDRYRPIVESLANLALNFSLVYFFGLYGVVISTIVSIVFINIPWSIHILFKHYFKTRCREYVFSILFYLLVLILASGGTYYVCSFVHLSSTVGNLAVKFAVCLVLPNALFALAFFKTKRFGESKELARVALKRR